MKPIRTLLTAALTLACATAALAQEEAPGVVRFEGAPNVITQRPDGTIVCETGPQVAPDQIGDQVGEQPPAPLSFYATHANNQFAFDLYTDLAAQPVLMPQNIFFSPVSINAALALTYEGVAGNTQAQFEQVLHLPEGMDRAGYHQSMAALLNSLNADDTFYELSVANSLWGERTMPFRNEFTQTLAEHYGAGFESVDFIGSPEAQRQRINTWVEQHTNERIVDLLPADSIDGLTRLVLANAIYFNADWQHPFNERLTEALPFQAPQNPLACSLIIGGTPTPTMTLPRAELRYADLDGLNIVELPYQGGDLSMLILLPDEVQGLAELESQLSAEALDGWLGELHQGSVRVQMPKWQMTQPTALIEPLVRLGMTDAFDHRLADFSRLSDSNTEGLAITDVVHQAFIRVDETGTEAAAATAVVVGLRSARIDEPFRFTADHPFVYIIRHNETGAVLFIGRVVSPQAPPAEEAE